MDYSASDFEKKYATNTDVLEQALQYIADDLELKCRFKVSDKGGRIHIEGNKE